MSLTALLNLLADGKVHSGERLAESLQVSRTAVWKMIERLREIDVDVQAQPRAGYRLTAPLELFDDAQIRAQLQPQHAARLQDLQIHFELDSTNTHLLQTAVPSADVAYACLAELQTKGRGRRGREWVSPFGAGVALSVSWCFQEMPKDLSALSLATGVAIARALRRIGAQGIALKWPNDIWWQDRKLGGVLIEMRSEAGGPAFVVIGIGLNVELGGAMRARIERRGVAVAALSDACERRPGRNATAGAIIDEVIAMLHAFSVCGFAPFKSEWMDLDALRDRPALIVSSTQPVSGIARGIDADGGLLLEVAHELQKFVSGDVSLRLQSGNV